MSMRISSGRGAAIGAMLLALAACDPAAMSGAAPTRTTVNVAGQAVTVAAPPGFCIDAPSTSITEAGAFVLISDCALLGGAGRAGAAPVGAALTASVSTAGLGDAGAAQSLDALAELAASAEGRAVLGRSGQIDRIRIAASTQRSDVLYLLIDDRGRQPIAGIDPQFWRAFLEVNGRMTALSVLGFEGAGVDPQQGLNHLAAFADAIQAANGG